MFFDKLKAFMPGTSESAFLKSLENMSKERKRVIYSLFHNLPADQKSLNGLDRTYCPESKCYEHKQGMIMQLNGLAIFCDDTWSV